RIYYDPLISHIYTKFKGYSLQISWLNNLKNRTYSKLQTKCSVLAYIDDTLWVASSQKQLTGILKIANSFYLIANIQVNPTKSILITNNTSPSYSPIIFNNYLLALYPSTISFKFLEC